MVKGQQLMIESGVTRPVASSSWSSRSASDSRIRRSRSSTIAEDLLVEKGWDPSMGAPDTPPDPDTES